jgi:hypothetical protein
VGKGIVIGRTDERNVRGRRYRFLKEMRDKFTK